MLQWLHDQLPRWWREYPVLQTGLFLLFWLQLPAVRALLSVGG